MQTAIDQFRANIDYVRNLNAIYLSLRVRTTGALDLSDILRAELVMAVSALDQYVHEVVRLGMLECHRGTRAITPAFLQFSVTLGSVRQGAQVPGNDDWLESEIRRRHGWQSFQRADRIADAFSLISGVSVWEEVAIQLGSIPQDMTRQLNLIVDRRNKIAHEADTDPTFGNRWPIDEALVQDAVSFIEQVVEAIHRVL